MTAPLVEAMKNFQAGRLDASALVPMLVASSWWVPFIDGEAAANYNDRQEGFMLCYTGEFMDSDFDNWRQLSGAEVIAELKADDELGVVFDYGYPWAINLRAHQTHVLFEATQSSE